MDSNSDSYNDKDDDTYSICVSYRQNIVMSNKNNLNLGIGWARYFLAQGSKSQLISNPAVTCVVHVYTQFQFQTCLKSMYKVILSQDSPLYQPVLFSSLLCN